MRPSSPPFNMDAYGPLNPSRVDKTTATSASAASAAATRQKSCNACVRGKRRCDKKAPKCTRCSSKGLDCIYARVPPGADASTVLLDDDYFSAASRNGSSRGGINSRDDSQTSTSTSDMPDFANLGGFVDMPSLAGSSAGNTSPGSSLDYTMDSSDVSTCMGPAGAAMPAGAATTATANNAAAADFMHMDDMSGFSIADLLSANNSSLGGDLWDMHSFPLDEAACQTAAAVNGHSNNNNTTTTTTTTQEDNTNTNTNTNNLHTFNLSNFPTGFDAATLSGKPDPRPLQVVPRRPLRDFSMYRDGCETAFDPLEIHDPRSRPGYVLKFFSDMHATFSRTRALPFLHPRLYSSSLPKTVMTAFCASAAYANRTPETKGWTVKLVMDAVKEVYNDGEKAGDSAAEKLARLHALLVLNTIRMLDGDMMLRAMAEKEANVMVEWTEDLIKVRDELEGNVPKFQWTDKAFPPKSWESWLLLESIRRTVHVAIFFLCLISILKGEAPQCSLWSQTIRFTASRHLWDAQSSVDFYRAWRDKPRFLVEQMQYRELWQYASPDDLDEFTKIMMTSQTGTEAMDHFMLGDTLVKGC